MVYTGGMGNATEAVAGRVHEEGFAVVEDVVDASTVDELIGALEEIGEGEGVRRRQSVYAIRNLLDQCPRVRELADSTSIRQYVDAILGPSAIAVRGILFDKTKDANWTVPWHQDVSIAVRERVEVDGYGPWSVKAGVPHVQPPASILEQMVAVRLHLDDCGLKNGPLEVIAGSHRVGRMPDPEIDRWTGEREGVVCTVGAGGVVLMRPLTLHRSLSSDASIVGHRRVVHIEYAAATLPGRLQWYQHTAD